MSNYKVKAAFLLFNINFKERKSFNSSYLNIKIGNIQHLTDIMSLVTGQSPPLSKLNIILIYFQQNIVGGLASGLVGYSHHYPRPATDQPADGLHHPEGRVGAVLASWGRLQEDNFILAVSVGQVYNLKYLSHWGEDSIEIPAINELEPNSDLQ